MLIFCTLRRRGNDARFVDVTVADASWFKRRGGPLLRSAVSAWLVTALLMCVWLTGCDSRPPTAPEPTPEVRDTPGWTVTADTVGLAPLGLSCESLPVYTGPAKPVAGSTISGQLINNGLDLSAGGITIERSCIQPTSIGRGLPVLTTTDNNTTFRPDLIQ